ncbi:MAG: SDR family NAD(P)-dependent oxidoreductase [Pseudomonadota bacterium]
MSDIDTVSIKQWKGKTVWITGASSGIGRCLSVKLANLGATVIISARRQDRLHEIASQAPQYILPLAADIADSGARTDIQQRLADRVEAIDVLIMSAGVVEYENELDLDADRYRRVFDVNFLGLVNSVAIAMPLLNRSKHKPYIVGITSLSVLVGFPRAEAYGASKAAADYFLKSLRMDLPADQFDLSIVRPGFVKTPMTSVNDFPMPFLISAEAAAERIVRGMNKRKMFVNFPWRFTFLLKCFSHLPYLWYKLLAPRMRRHKTQKTVDSSRV